MWARRAEPSIHTTITISQPASMPIKIAVAGVTEAASLPISPKAFSTASGNALRWPKPNAQVRASQVGGEDDDPEMQHTDWGRHIATCKYRDHGSQGVLGKSYYRPKITMRHPNE
jgi:hypothetical protein